MVIPNRERCSIPVIVWEELYNTRSAHGVFFFLEKTSCFANASLCQDLPACNLDVFYMCKNSAKERIVRGRVDCDVVAKIAVKKTPCRTIAMTILEVAAFPSNIASCDRRKNTHQFWVSCFAYLCSQADLEMPIPHYFTMGESAVNAQEREKKLNQLLGKVTVPDKTIAMVRQKKRSFPQEVLKKCNIDIWAFLTRLFLRRYKL